MATANQPINAEVEASKEHSMSPNPAPLIQTAKSPDYGRPDHGDFRPGSDLNDEIDLLELIQSVLKTWKVWLIAAFVLTAIFGYFQVTSYLVKSKNAGFSKQITLNFKGADKGEYPSGTPFRLQDIIAPAVLQAVYTDLGLDEEGITNSEFQSKVSVEPFTPYYKEIIEKYDSLLDETGDNYEQIQAIQEKKRAELAQALNSNVLLTFDVEDIDLPAEVVTSIMTAIPQQWARQAITDKGVLKADIELISSRTLDQTLFENVDYVVLADLFADKIQGLRDNIKKVKALEGSATVKDPESGWSLSDLERNLYDLETYTVDELMSPIRSLGLSRNPKLAAFYYDEKRLVLKEELAKLEDQSALIKSAFDSYSQEKQTSTQVSGGGQASVLGAPMVPQMSGELLDKLLQVAGEDSVEKYRQVLNDQWLKTNMEVAELKSDIRRIERLIAAVKGQQSDELTNELRDEYTQRAEESLPSIIAQLRNYYDINWRIYEQISRDSVGGVGYLYKDAHQGVLKASSGMDLKRIILMYIALIAGMTFVVVPTVMIRNALRDKKRRELTAQSELQPAQ